MVGFSFRLSQFHCPCPILSTCGVDFHFCSLLGF
ncbi:unnamed protein product [Arabidopsis halleri]